jgi:hypothetical protein
MMQKYGYGSACTVIKVTDLTDSMCAAGCVLFAYVLPGSPTNFQECKAMISILLLRQLGNIGLYLNGICEITNKTVKEKNKTVMVCDGLSVLSAYINVCQ